MYTNFYNIIWEKEKKKMFFLCIQKIINVLYSFFVLEDSEMYTVVVPEG